MGSIVQDLKQAGRVLMKHPGSLLAALATLALGIGFSTATFSVVNAVLLRPLPYEEPDRLVRFIERVPPRETEFAVAPAHYLFWRDHASAFEGIAAWAQETVTVDTGTAGPQRIQAHRVSVDLFPLLGVTPIAGRGFEQGDEQEQQEAVALLSRAAWERRFGADPRIVGRAVRVNGQPVTIIGIMPDGVWLASRETEMWLPFVVTARERQNYTAHFMTAIGRLKPGVTREAAAADMRVVSNRLAETNPGSKGWEVQLVDLHQDTVAEIQLSLLVLLGAVALVLLIACANVANLLLARGAARQRELAIRSSIGATRIRLLRQLLAECLALAAVSVAAGVLFAGWLLRILLSMIPDALPAHASVSLDGQVLLFALLLAILTPLVFGLLPAIQSSRPDLRSLMSAGGRTGAGVPGGRTRAALVVAEVALAMMLLVGAGLLMRSFTHLARQSPGFDPAQTLTAEITLLPARYPEGEARERFLGEFLDRVRALPAVDAAGVTTSMPLMHSLYGGVEVEGDPVTAAERALTAFSAVSTGYFDAMRIPLLKGRYLDAGDRRGGVRVAVINETLAGLHFGGADPIGRRIRVSQGDREWREVVGVVGDVKQRSLDERPGVQVYEAAAQHPRFDEFSVVVRTRSGEATAVVPELRAILRNMDPALPLAQVRTLDDVVGGSIQRQRFSATLLGVFGGAALLLAAVGVYGVVAYTVGLRRQEFAIRIAHGAQASDILALVLRSAAGLSLAGIALGLVAAWQVRGALQSLLFNVSSVDVSTYAIVAAVLGGTVLLASCMPALRATRVDPVEALRGE